MVYSFLLNKLLELDIIKYLEKTGISIKSISIFELPYLKFRPADIFITCQKYEDSNPIVKALNIHKIVITSRFPEFCVPSEWLTYIYMPIDYAELANLINSLI